ncbi:hypothetical protein KUCAC02_006252, partial [Chaenocephalus aceratus]
MASTAPEDLPENREGLAASGDTGTLGEDTGTPGEDNGTPMEDNGTPGEDTGMAGSRKTTFVQLFNTFFKMKHWLIPTSEKADRPAEKAAEESGVLPSQRPSTSCTGRRGGGVDDNRKVVHKQSDQPSSKCCKYREEYI